jgi:hypothetical protein
MRTYRLAGTVAILATLSAACLASPLEWLEGSYHGTDGDTRIEENWVVGPDGQAVGTTIWLKHGVVELRETAQIKPQGKGYQLSLWITHQGGDSQRIDMSGKLAGANQLKFQTGPDKAPESLSYQKDSKGHLRVVLAKKQLMSFDLSPGPGSANYCPQPVGLYKAHTFFANSKFEDEIEFSQSPDADLRATLNVPNKFKVPLEHLKLLPNRNYSFDALIPEGAKPYRVRYQVEFSNDMQQATGAIYSEGGKRLGSLVLTKAEKAPAP